MIKLFDPHVTDDEIHAAKEVLLSRNWASGAGGNKVKKFEDMFNEYLGSREVVAVNSGTAALHLALAIIDLKDKDVLVPSLTFVSTAHAALYNGGNPVFVDVDPVTLCMDPGDLERKIQRDKSAVIVPVHFGGMPCNMKELIKISKSYDIKVIDDAAHACGSKYNGMKIGSFEEMTCFSFHPVKNLSMPTGGAISINHGSAEESKRKLNSIRWCGIDNRQGHSYDVTSVAPNYYMNEISAAIGLVQLNKLDDLNTRRLEIARRYANEIKIEYKMPYFSDCVYHLYWIISEKRDELIRYLNSRGIEVGTHYRPIHTMSAYSHKSNDANTPITDDVGKKIVTIPIHTNLSDANVSYIIESINLF
jgi:perosamine synthetase